MSRTIGDSWTGSALCSSQQKERITKVCCSFKSSGSNGQKDQLIVSHERRESGTMSRKCKMTRDMKHFRAELPAHLGSIMFVGNLYKLLSKQIMRLFDRYASLEAQRSSTKKLGSKDREAVEKPVIVRHSPDSSFTCSEKPTSMCITVPVI